MTRVNSKREIAVVALVTIVMMLAPLSSAEVTDSIQGSTCGVDETTNKHETCEKMSESPVTGCENTVIYVVPETCIRDHCLSEMRRTTKISISDNGDIALPDKVTLSSQLPNTEQVPTLREPSFLLYIVDKTVFGASFMTGMLMRSIGMVLSNIGVLVGTCWSWIVTSGANTITLIAGILCLVAISLMGILSFSFWKMSERLAVATTFHERSHTEKKDDSFKQGIVVVPRRSDTTNW